MKKRLFIFLAIALMAISIISCAKSTTTTGTYPLTQKDYGEGVNTGYIPPVTTTMPAITRTVLPEDVYSAGSGETLSVPNDTDRMIVRTGNMALVVVDIPATITRITQIAGVHQGYVVSSQSWKEGQLLRGTISIRIIAGDYDAVVNEVGSLAVEITSQTTSSQDVTEEYIDLSAQLNNLQATELQLLQVMSKAETVEDILAVQRELTNTRDSIERTQARMQYLERTSSTSLLNIQLEQSKLKVDFNAYNTIVKVDQEISFSPDVAGGFYPYTYEWDFGDNQTSNDIAPTHKYKSAGTYTVTLKVTDDRQNTDTKVREDYITVQPGWSAGSIAGNAWSGMVTFGRVLANIFIWLGIFSPVWIIAGGIGYWLYRRNRKKASR
jgi:hypothetical protein